MIVVIKEEARFVRKYGCAWLLFSTLTLSARRFAPCPISPITGNFTDGPSWRVGLCGEPVTGCSVKYLSTLLSVGISTLLYPLFEVRFTDCRKVVRGSGGREGGEKRRRREEREEVEGWESSPKMYV